jgi:predicted metal-dependent enzyme (double-stranded beta helix superfamily)
VCDLHDHGAALEPLEHDEYVLDTPVVRTFVDSVRTAAAGATTPAEAVAAIEPHFAALLARPDWLPDRFQHDAPAGGMGGGIGQWLLYRSADRSLCLFSLVVPPGSRTPIHDHGAWGLVGLYRGSQDEELYRPRPGGLDAATRRPLAPGDWYALLPPDNDVHRVTTTSPETSVSIHLLANDTGCVVRRVFDEATGGTRPFRSGYVNAACPEGEPIRA